MHIIKTMKGHFYNKYISHVAALILLFFDEFQAYDLLSTMIEESIGNNKARNESMRWHFSFQEEQMKNRVNLLHSQEKTVLSKVDSTKKSMHQLRENRSFLEENERIRLDSVKRKQKELNELKAQVKDRKEQLKEGLVQSKTLKDIRSMNTNITYKEEQKQNKKVQILNKLEDILKNATLHQSVKAMENLIEEKRKREVLERKIRLKEELVRKLEKEEISRRNYEKALGDFEREEMEICQGLSGNEGVEEVKGRKKINVSRK